MRVSFLWMGQLDSGSLRGYCFPEALYIKHLEGLVAFGKSLHHKIILDDLEPDLGYCALHALLALFDVQNYRGARILYKYVEILAGTRIIVMSNTDRGKLAVLLRQKAIA